MARTLKIYSKGKRVKKLQVDLIQLGYDIKADGAFGLKTLSAVADFQRQQNMKLDGIAGHFTEMAFFNALNKVELIEPATEHFKLSEFI